MKKEHFDGLVQSARDAGAYLRGEKVPGVRVTKVEPNAIAAIRIKLGFNQGQFAKALGISIDTLQNWEQGRRHPTGPAKVLLRVAAKHPKAVFEAA